MIKTKLFLQIFGLVAFIEQKENDNNDNICKVHGDLYNASVWIPNDLEDLILLTPKHYKGHHGFYIDCHCYRFFSLDKGHEPKICKKSVYFYCITISLWKTPVNHYEI